MHSELVRHSFRLPLPLVATSDKNLSPFELPNLNVIDNSHDNSFPFVDVSHLIGDGSGDHPAQSIHGDFPTPDDDIPMVDKIVNASWNKEASTEKPAAISKAPEAPGLYTLPDDCKSHGISNNLISGAMAVVMGFVTLLKVTRAVPKMIVNAAKDYTTPVYNVETTLKQQQLPAPVPTVPTVSMAEFSAVTKRLGELEDRMRVMSSKPAEIPFEKEQMLNAATSRVDKLETELQATQKALQDALTRQEELLAYVEKKKKKKRGFFWSSSKSSA